VTADTSAIRLNYQMGTGSTIDGNFIDPGLVIKTSLVNDKEINFSLEDWESWTFDFFNIWTEEGIINDGEDTISKPITATLNFNVPGESFSLKGSTVGVSGILQFGKVKWGSPLRISAADRSFLLSLSDEEFSKGLFGLKEKEKATVKATVKQISSEFSVPDNGSTAMLLGLGFLSLALACRRRTAI
jgi:protein with PEP-CTERM/exosortase system signal